MFVLSHTNYIDHKKVRLDCIYILTRRDNTAGATSSRATRSMERRTTRRTSLTIGTRSFYSSFKIIMTIVYHDDDTGACMYWEQLKKYYKSRACPSYVQRNKSKVLGKRKEEYHHKICMVKKTTNKQALAISWCIVNKVVCDL